jgi:CRP/FNR family cyclic AMP-dependent transcriptional regulator
VDLQGMSCSTESRQDKGETVNARPSDSFQPLLFEAFGPESSAIKSLQQSALDSDIEALGRNQLLKRLSSQELLQERLAMQECHFSAGQIISCEGCEDQRFHAITKGKVEFLISDGKGGEISVGQSEAGGFFGELALLSHQACGLRIRALEEVSTFALGEQQFSDFVRRHPEVASDLLRDIAPRLAQMDHLLRNGVSRNVATELDQKMTWIDKLADRFASATGTWQFIVTEGALVGGWLLWNLIPGVTHFDPYPFLLLNSAFAAQAAFAGLIIMMSQNRQSAHDRLAAHVNHEVTVKAELGVELVLKRIGDLEKRLTNSNPGFRDAVAS